MQTRIQCDYTSKTFIGETNGEVTSINVDGVIHRVITKRKATLQFLSRLG